jgi:YD repeat-containing protein
MFQPLQFFKLPLKSRKSITVAALLLFFISCSEKDHAPQQTCVFAGKSASMSSGETSQSSYGNEISLNDQKQLVSAQRFTNNEAFASNKARLWKQSFTGDYELLYDSEGFLTQMVYITKDLYEGTIGNSYQYNSQPYLNFKTETTETSDYKYESGHIASISTKYVTRIQGDNQILSVNESKRTKIYTYDSQGKPVSALTTIGNTKATTTFTNGIIATETSKNANGEIISQNQYNERGLQTSISSSNYLYEKKYDVKGNLTSLQFTQNGKLNYLQEFSYDDHKNPEIDIPMKFKGIPENIITVQSNDGVNNLTGEKFTSYAGGVNYDSPFVYQYNEAGLPESWSPKDAGDGQTMKTTFRYQCQ